MSERHKLLPAYLPAVGMAGRIITAYKNGWCPANNILYERVKRAAKKFPGKVILNTINTFDKEVMQTCGKSDEIFIEKKLLSSGPLQAKIKF